MADMIKVAVRRGDIAKFKAPAVAVDVYEGVETPGGATRAVDEAAGGIVGRALASGDFKGKLGETMVLYPETGPAERILVLGLGKKDAFDGEGARQVGAAMARALRAMGVKSAVTVVPGGGGGAAAELARSLAEGLITGLYRYQKYFRDGRAEELALETLTVVESPAARVRAVEKGVRLGVEVGESVNVTRDLVNGPGNEITPSRIAATARELGRKVGFKVKVMGRDECEKLGMGAFLAVAQGSDEPCKFIVMEYEGGTRGTVCLVGKGVTFDTGGISLKPAAEMDLMKYDMGGSGAVLGAMHFAAVHRVPMKVVGIVASTENMPGGRAYKPGDIVTASNGVTIDVKNTDAEGRLILADALVYAARYRPDAVVDLATLTGACMIALGHGIAAMGNDEWLLDTVVGAASASRERVWPMPLWPEYRDKIKSDVADIKNSAGREAGALTAGAFLGAFTDAYRWVHLDIAGSAWNTTPTPVLAAGASGAGVRTLCQFLIDWKPPRGKSRDPRPGPRTSLRGVDPVDASGDPVNPLRSPGARKAAKRRAAAKPTTRKKAARRTKKSPRSGR